MEDSEKTKQLQFINEVGDELVAFLNQFFNESPRARIILVGSLLDLEIENILKNFMKPHPGGRDNLFAPERPLASFSTKINLAFRLGLIDEDVESALHIIRKIRNDFAHTLTDPILNVSPHKERIANLKKIVCSNHLGSKIMKNSAGLRGDLFQNDFDHDFYVSISILINFFQLQRNKVKKNAYETPVTFKISKFDKNDGKNKKRPQDK